jgi:hypothetical protein
VRDIVRVLRVSSATVIDVLKKKLSSWTKIFMYIIILILIYT